MSRASPHTRDATPDVRGAGVISVAKPGRESAPSNSRVPAIPAAPVRIPTKLGPNADGSMQIPARGGEGGGCDEAIPRASAVVAHETPGRSGSSADSLFGNSPGGASASSGIFSADRIAEFWGKVTSGAIKLEKKEDRKIWRMTAAGHSLDEVATALMKRRGWRVALPSRDRRKEISQVALAAYMRGCEERRAERGEDVKEESEWVAIAHKANRYWRELPGAPVTIEEARAAVEAGRGTMTQRRQDGGFDLLFRYLRGYR